MKLLFSFELAGLQARAGMLMNSLLHRGHEIWIWNPEVNPQDFDLWFFDLSTATDEEQKKAPQITKPLQAYRGIPICISFDDSPFFHERRLTPEAREKTRLFLGNMIYRDQSHYSKEVIHHTGLLYNFIETGAYLSRHAANIKKTNSIFFAGLLTGMVPHLSCRVDLIKKIKASGLPFRGGLTGIDPPLVSSMAPLVTPDLMMPRMNIDSYLEIFLPSLISLCPRGNGYTTYRFFEALGAGSLALGTPLDELELLGNPQPGQHYEVFQPDCSDLIEKCSFYLEHPDQALAIAARGKQLWETYYKIENDRLSQPAMDLILSDIQKHAGVSL